MTKTQFDFDSAACSAAAAAFKGSLPKGMGGGTAWNIENFSTWVAARYPWVSVEAGQEWGTTRQNLWLVCTAHGRRYQTLPDNILKGSRGCQCRECANEANSTSAGKIRKPRASAAEKRRATELYTELGSYAKVGRILGRSDRTILNWLNPEVAERDRERSRRWDEANRDRHRATKRRYKTEFEHGRAVNKASHSKRRKAKRGEMWIDEDGTKYLLIDPPKSAEDLSKEQQIYIECERLTRETGVVHHVDHIMPLCMGGQHAWWNLQILTAEENMSKGGKFREEDRLLYTKRLLELIHNEKL
jgi:5-methylcytosine-specific restriction endonuclease McrA